MKKIFFSLLILSIVAYLPAFGFGRADPPPEATLDTLRVKDNAGENINEHKKHKKKKDKKILVPEEDIRLELDRAEEKGNDDE